MQAQVINTGSLLRISTELQIHIGKSRSFSLLCMCLNYVSSVLRGALRLLLSSKYLPFYGYFLMEIRETGEICQ